ncbi:MAG: hypothetical protein ACTS73_05075 [Arsenophonus sp. NEOnobi-MAG3]
MLYSCILLARFSAKYLYAGMKKLEKDREEFLTFSMTSYQRPL